jgi:class 3 adenylate cyclase
MSQAIHIAETVELSATRVLYNYLCQEADNMDFNDIDNTGEAYALFEELIADELICVPFDCKLRNVLQSYGWMHDHFEVEEGEADVFGLREELGNIYLTQAVSDKETETPESVMSMFCPNLLMTLLNKKRELFVDGCLKPCSLRFEGCVMLADISGFTNLASSLCRMKGSTDKKGSSIVSTMGAVGSIRDFVNTTMGNGSKGLDELRTTTNVYLGGLVQSVYSFEGDVIAFAGDALLCVFTDELEEDVGAEVACVRAVKCAKHLLSLSAAESEHPLKLHVALSKGDLDFAIVGGVQESWTYVLNGACIRELSVCIDEAKVDEIVMTPALHELLQTQGSRPDLYCSCKPTESGMMKIDPTKTIPNSRSTGRSLISSQNSTGSEPLPTDAHTYGLRQVLSDVIARGRKIDLDIAATPSETSSLPLTISNIRKSPSTVDQHNSPGLETRRLESFLKPFSRRNPIVVRAQPKDVRYDLLKKFIPAPVTAAILGGTVSASELRQVTTMFLKLDSYDPEQFADPLALQEFLCIVQRALHETGGFLRQFLVDDKGEL